MTGTNGDWTSSLMHHAGVPWTHFHDMHSGGGQKLPWAHILIEAPESEAKKLFAEAFGRNPDNVTCNCCGEDYAISEEPTLAEATGFYRGLTWASPLGGGRWHEAPLEERQAANRVGRYIEPGEALPDGWSFHDDLPNRSEPMTLDEFLLDPHFERWGRREEVKIVSPPKNASPSPSGDNPT